MAFQRASKSLMPWSMVGLIRPPPTSAILPWGPSRYAAGCALSVTRTCRKDCFRRSSADQYNAVSEKSAGEFLYRSYMPCF
jgi:hypothetical protein